MIISNSRGVLRDTSDGLSHRRPKKRITFALSGSQNDTPVCLAGHRVSDNERNFSISSDAELFSTRGEQVASRLLKECFHQVFSDEIPLRQLKRQ
jgi:hypothetical protein